jgi:hypothetical protein
MNSSYEEEIVILDSQDEYEEDIGEANFASGSRPIPVPRAAAATENNQDSDGVIDLTGSPEIEIVSSNLPPVPRPPKRPRVASPGNKNKALRTSAAAAAAAEPSALECPPSPKGPKCGICLEVMGGNTDRTMMAGNCG